MRRERRQDPVRVTSPRALVRTHPSYRIATIAELNRRCEVLDTECAARVNP